MHEFRAFAPTNWAAEQRKDPELLKIIRALESDDPSHIELFHTLPNYGWTRSVRLADGSVLVRTQRSSLSRLNLPMTMEQIIVPKQLQGSIVNWAHSSYPYTHASARVTIDWIANRYWWWGMQSHVKIFIKDCWCWKERHPDAAPLYATPFQHLVPKFGDLVHMDLAGPFPKDKIGNSMLLVIVDSATGWCDGCALPDKQAITVLKAFQSVWCSRYGYPMAAMTDGGSEFTASIWQTFYNAFGIRKLTSAAENPRANGKAESLVKSFKWLLKSAILRYRDASTWSELIQQMFMVIRTTMKYQSRRPSPDLAFLGFKLNTPLDVLSGASNVPDTQRLIQQRRDVFKWLQKAVADFAVEYERRVPPPRRRFYVGELVYLIKKVTFNKNKTGVRAYDGPFRIAKVVGASTYLLAKPDGSPLPHRIPVPLRRLLPYHEIEQVQDFSDEIIKLLEASARVASFVQEGAGGFA